MTWLGKGYSWTAIQRFEKKYSRRKQTETVLQLQRYSLGLRCKIISLCTNIFKISFLHDVRDNDGFHSQESEMCCDRIGATTQTANVCASMKVRKEYIHLQQMRHSQSWRRPVGAENQRWIQAGMPSNG